MCACARADKRWSVCACLLMCLSVSWFLCLVSLSVSVCLCAGAVYTLGSNLRGQLGPRVGGGRRSEPGGDDANPRATELARALLGGEEAVAIGAGDYATLVLTASGRLWGLGRNRYGQLGEGAGGIGGTAAVAVPVCVSCQLPGAGWSMEVVLAGADHVLTAGVDAEGSGAVWAQVRVMI